MYKTFGIFAHVDTGKTTFSEQLLYYGQSLKKRGRVDHRDAFLDMHPIEKERGITVYAEQGIFTYNGHTYTLIDTPGHIDFSPEMERTIRALDYAVVLIDAVDGVEGHTYTVWQLLRQHNIPTFIFVNKMDREGADLNKVLVEIKQQLFATPIVFTNRFGASIDEAFIEEVVATDERLLENYLEGQMSMEHFQKELFNRINRCELVPVHYGSALHDEGIAAFLRDFDTFTRTDFSDDQSFEGTIFKIRHDENNQRIAHIKIHSGTLKTRDQFVLNDQQMKVSALYVQNGLKRMQIDEAHAGQCVAVIGLKNAEVGMTLGNERVLRPQQLVPLLRAKIVFEAHVDKKIALSYFKLLEVEDPSLQVVWENTHEDIILHIMGTIQLEILERIVKERFGLTIAFEQPTILYKETIESTVKGYGHFEPLKHYAEVHLRLEPLPLQSGIQFKNECHANDLSIGHQNAIEKIVLESHHHGILTGSPITNMRMTLVTGKAHVKHTEGGDFKEATHRAIRQGLEQANNRLLEPYYAFELRAPLAYMGKMMTDLELAKAQLEPPEVSDTTVSLKGFVPVATFLEYPTEFSAYTGGKGKLNMRFGKYDLCHNERAVIEKIGYDKNADPLYTSNSIFCAHGKGYVVPWHEAKAAMHANVERP